MASRSVVLAGTPVVAEEGTATAAITPGMLVQGITSVAPFSTAGGPAPRRFALERDEIGKGIDDAYAVGDTVKVGSFAPGSRVNALINSGVSVTAGGFLEPAADGTLRAFASGTRIAVALESATATARRRLRVEIY